jgi:hypothetical protein
MKKTTANMDSLIQQVKTQPIVKETDVGNNKKTKIAKPSKFEAMFKEMKVSEEYTKKAKYKFDHFKDNTFPQKGYNIQADLLMLPITNDGYRYLLTVIDIWSNYIDFEPLKTKTAKETLAAIKTIFNRKYLNEPIASIKTDSGREFLESFDQYFKKQKIAHLINLPDRHSQMAKVENLNKQIARLIMTYITEKTMELGEQYREWTDVLDIIRKGLNEIKAHPKDEDPFEYPMAEPKVQALPKYKTGDIVYRPLGKPIGEYGKFQSGDSRYDMVPRKVKNVYLLTIIGDTD